MTAGALPQAAFQEERALKKAARLHQVKHVFLYALNPDHLLIRWDEAYAVHPLDDAFTASMKVQRPYWSARMHGKEAHALYARDATGHTLPAPARRLRDADLPRAAEATRLLTVRNYLTPARECGHRLWNCQSPPPSCELRNLVCLLVLSLRT